ncbi:NAD(P)/FAD-dependent oxidoreductase [Croceicoccus bisphenolivorans]|uniref:FAD/NAD(P)-dependent oxidoreductase n=1 Tax=Croceicoccus bisphenolivorans TaxID=1783232 RepID=UPI00082B59AF|nr:FAD/NAD(P)-binding oxidoreductase [Croceicoccus bisphenolivorans]
MVEKRVIVVGAGPAGIRAAETLVAAGIRPVLIDEGRRDGGQIYRRQPDGFTRSYETLYGTEAARARAVHDTFEAIRDRIDYRAETLAWNVSDGRLWTARDGEAEAIPYSALIVCSGATDRLLPVPGWNRAGVFSLGGSQIALKAQACSIGSKVVFMGSGPLLYLVAAQYVKAGANVAAVLDTSPFMKRVRAAPFMAVLPDLLFAGVGLMRTLKTAGVRIATGITPVSIEGSDDTGVSGIRYTDGSGREQHMDCDAVAMGWHLRPETQLADIARCDFAFDAPTRQWLPVTDDDGRATSDGIYLAGDGARVLGARCAEVTGRLAAMAALSDMGIAGDPAARQSLLAEKARYRRFAQGLAIAFPWPHELAANVPDDTVVCRCEAVTAGTLRETVDIGGATETNRAKSFSRVGMGRCQGRYCGNASAEIVAAMRREPVEAAGRLRTQAPVKPLSIATVRNEA